MLDAAWENGKGCRESWKERGGIERVSFVVCLGAGWGVL